MSDRNICSVSAQSVSDQCTSDFGGRVVTPLSLPDPIGTKPRHFTYLALAMCVLATAFIAERASYWSRYWMSGPDVEFGKRQVSVNVGKTQLHLPLELIATPRQRHRSLSSDTVFKTLRLSMVWPALSASQGLYSGFGDKLGTGQTILIELESNQGRESLRARLDPFYRRLARGGEIRGPGGLRILTLSAKGSATSDLIVYDPSERNGFIARCTRKSGSGNAICHRAIALASGLELRYRFDQSLLADWQELDRSIVQKISGFRTS